MAARIDTSPARGTRDVLPDEVALRDHAQAVILATYERHGYAHVETPVLESLELLAGSQGGENEKLIFRVLKRGQKLDEALARLQAAGAPPADGSALHAELTDFGLRYDLTVPLARYYAQNHARLPQPFKAIQIGPVFRAERPQKGRYRQFTQCDIDVLGEPSLVAEVDLIAATTGALGALGLSGFTVRVNDRRLLTQLAEACSVPAERHEAVFIALDKLDKLGWDGVEAELAAAGLDGFAAASLRRRLPAVQELVACVAGGGDTEAAAAEAGFGDPAAALDLARILSALSAAGVLPQGAQVLHDPTLVRGMGYYTGPIFEIGVEGLPFSLAGGGRYDRMIGRLLGRDVPACGFSIGFERLVLVLQAALEHGTLPGLRAAPAVAVLCEPGEPGPALVRAARLRGDARGFRVSLLAARPTKKRGKQLDELQRQGFAYFVAPDADELRPLSSGGGTSR